MNASEWFKALLPGGNFAFENFEPLIYRYDASEVEAPPPLQYDSSIDERDLTVDEWRKALWEEVTNWTPHPGYANHSSSSTATTTTTTTRTQMDTE